MQLDDARGVPRIPKLLRHKSGRAFARVHTNGRARDFYFGPFGSVEAKQRYAAFVAALLAGEDLVPQRRREQEVSSPTIDELIIVYKTEELAHRSVWVRDHADRSLRDLQARHGRMPASQFGPRLLASLRDAMAESGRFNRRELNRMVQGIKRFFRWCVARELVPADTAHALAALASLRAGDSRLREPKVVRPAAWAAVEATLPHLSTPLRAAVLVMWWSGARAGELLQARPCDIDRSKSPWRFTPPHHKTQHHGKARTIWFGPEARAILGPLLLRAAPNEFLFRPADALEEQKRQRRQQRRSKLTPSQRARDEANARSPKLAVGARYDTHALTLAITRAINAANAPDKIAAMRTKLLELLPDRSGAIDAACARLASRMPRRALDRLAEQACGDEHESRRQAVRKALEAIRKAPGRVPRWSCHQLRHAAATRVEAGSHDHDGTRAVLGHSSLNVTQIYVERDERRAAELMERLG